MTGITASAGDHEWRAITVHIHPSANSASATVVLRRMKGVEIVWQHRALSLPINGLVLSEHPSTRECLAFVVDALQEIVGRTDG
jgi:hypothetical protein